MMKHEVWLLDDQIDHASDERGSALVGRGGAGIGKIDLL
jgi:hypothetical protein